MRCPALAPPTASSPKGSSKATQAVGSSLTMAISHSSQLTPMMRASSSSMLSTRNLQDESAMSRPYQPRFAETPLRPWPTVLESLCRHCILCVQQLNCYLAMVPGMHQSMTTRVTNTVTNAPMEVKPRVNIHPLHKKPPQPSVHIVIHTAIWERRPGSKSACTFRSKLASGVVWRGHVGEVGWRPQIQVGWEGVGRASHSASQVQVRHGSTTPVLVTISVPITISITTPTSQ